MLFSFHFNLFMPKAPTKGPALPLQKQTNQILYKQAYIVSLTHYCNPKKLGYLASQTNYIKTQLKP